MPKAIEDLGHLAQATKPLKPKVYESGKLPCPIQCAGALVVGVNRADHNRLALYLSDGSSWHAVALGGVVQQQALVPVDRDLTPMIRAAVEQALPTLVATPAVKVIQGPQSAANPDIPALAHGLLELTDHATRLEQEIDDLRALVESQRQHLAAIDSTPIKEAAAA